MVVPKGWVSSFANIPLARINLQAEVIFYYIGELKGQKDHSTLAHLH